MMDQNGSQDKRKYEPPKVTVISLRPEEAVLGHCKNGAHGGPAGPTCSTAGNCTVPGS
jgi:hypothetical protein